MRTGRFVIADCSWEIVEPLWPGGVRDRGRTARDNRLFLEAVFGRFGSAVPGAACHLDLESGTACSGAFADGRNVACFNGFLRWFRAIQILSALLSMRRFHQ